MLSISFFRAYQLFLGTQDDVSRLTDSLVWWRGLGGNTIRVFFTHGAPADNMFLPWKYSAYYPVLPEFFEYVNGLGLRVHATCLTGQNPGNPEYMDGWAREVHVRAIATAAGYRNLTEYVNEDFKNGLVAYSLPNFGSLSHCCRSCHVWDSAVPDLQWSSLHPERKGGFDDERKIHDLVEIPFPGPRLVGESGKVVADYSAEEIRVCASEARALGEGFNVHGAWDGDGIQQCRVPTGEALSVVEAACDEWAKDADLIPPEASSWPYYRDEATRSLVYRLGGPAAGGGTGAQHFYCLGDGSRELVLITEPSPGLPHESQPGWRILREDVTAVYSERI